MAFRQNLRDEGGIVVTSYVPVSVQQKMKAQAEFEGMSVSQWVAKTIANTIQTTEFKLQGDPIARMSGIVMKKILSENETSHQPQVPRTQVQAQLALAEGTDIPQSTMDALERHLLARRKIRVVPATPPAEGLLWQAIPEGLYDDPDLDDFRGIRSFADHAERTMAEEAEVRALQAPKVAGLPAGEPSAGLVLRQKKARRA